jgi:hypothetical protein
MSPLAMLVAAVVTAVVALNIAATLAVLSRERDLLLRRRQLALVWLVPLLGSTLALVAHVPDPPPRPSPDPTDFRDDGGVSD